MNLQDKIYKKVLKNKINNYLSYQFIELPNKFEIVRYDIADVSFYIRLYFKDYTRLITYQYGHKMFDLFWEYNECSK